MSRHGAHSTSPNPDDPGGRDGERRTISRRRFLGWTVAGGATAAVVAAEIESGGRKPARSAAGSDHRATVEGKGKGPTSTTPTTQPPDGELSYVEGVPLPTSPAIIAENSRTGDLWWVTSPQEAGDMEGFADQVSGQVGDTVTLMVNTKAATFHVEAYRMGYYQGIGGRLVWQSAEVPGVRQPPPVVAPGTSTVECHWTPSVEVVIGPAWPPGAYLFKLVGATGEQGLVPFCVRDDSSDSAFLFQQSVTTWQAYNLWGGYSLYYGNVDGDLTYTQNPGNATYEKRARIVSFDRPYTHDWASGASDFVGNELPVVFQAERLGLDVSYWTDIDLHQQPQLLANHRALFSLGHDEYWSTPMRDGVETALQQGLNVAFLGANACYRQIRLQPSALGPDRYQVCYKTADEDPLYGKDNALVSVDWDLPPVSNPESSLKGNTYQDIDALADMVIVDPGSWLLAGTGLTAGQQLPNVVRGEFDRYVPGGAAPSNVDVIAHSLVANRDHNFSDVTWYTTAAGGGVLDTGNASWVGQLADAPLIPSLILPAAVPGVTEHLQRIMLNVYSVLGTAPASITNPSTGNWRAAYHVD
ncbi:MAG: N,N-dimethylformamidase beta subunit family domain-containing protein [Acidimicrobiales bacterium]|jgi:hypothetical protein